MRWAGGGGETIMPQGQRPDEEVWMRSEGRRAQGEGDGHGGWGLEGSGLVANIPTKQPLEGTGRGVEAGPPHPVGAAGHCRETVSGQGRGSSRGEAYGSGYHLLRPGLG